MSKILVPVDGSDYSKRALEQALSIAKGNASTGAVVVTAIHVIVPMPTVNVGSQKVLDDAKAKLRSEASKLLDECKATAKERAALDIETVILVGTSPGESIVGFCEKGNFNLIVMGAKGHSKLKDIVLGSTSDKVVHHAKCSVLVVR
ncbi:universal stress protein UspA-like protein [Candidatus Nitrososphaera evergladensis SR1]|uniref:Universal stress protein UspA-like protein n=1 Tax=Candidatus Nitrososphaera evergladensis SR1 TaxID=1459636 RepID=A0A075MWI2_9ARCH|nr:universal stress protein [Candidatus Nitrososphaera evergladensis]AIF85488.1 universal stress protein UspA-like protein [Candidatus Nitrososphaera evergladensis SR1]